jgi:diaminopimelate epimerase
MPKGIPNVKGHAYGNDFLLAPEPAVRGSDPGVLARAMCSRHEGVGADGLMIYTALGSSSLSMQLFNADGSPSEVSGNGIRCLAHCGPGVSGQVTITPAALRCWS